MKLSDGSTICYDRGSEYGTYAIEGGDLVKKDEGSDWRYIVCEEYDLNHYEPGLGTGGINEKYSGKQWGFYGTSTGITDTAIGTGKNNTDHLISKNNNSTDTPWYYVNQHRTNTGKPWYVPSKDELNILYENKTAIGNFSTSTNSWYFSSSEYSSSHAWGQDFSDGRQGSNLKSNKLCRIRCIRYV